MSVHGRVEVGVVGLGYWGSNVARVLDALPDCDLKWCCDVDLSRAHGIAAFPAARFTVGLDDLLADPALDAIAVATPVATHATVAQRVLEAGKHCFVEKPLAHSAADADRLLALAEASERTLMAGHLLEYHPGVEALAELIDGGELGQIHYIYSQRLNLGKLRADENALWSLGAHDVSMVLALVGELPVEVSARGESYVRNGVEDVVFAHLRFRTGVTARMHLSWLDPHKERRLTVVGSKRMATFDDMAVHKLTVYDKGFDPDGDSTDEYVTRSGSARTPSISGEEPLRIELGHFVGCVRDDHRPRSDGASGGRVVRVLESLQASLGADGATVEMVGDAVR
ncbi:MAG TPA: Gfo/Idh/MocA family oxidoreductase [Solirubrobacterales bacterium]|nr:Gfo/Idh/MocA family oxidoreductase [Solirubrobacterales bacterium]